MAYYCTSKSMQSWVEVAPQPLITPQRYSSVTPKLETIYEEGPHPGSHHQAQGDDRTVDIHLPRKAVFPLPRSVHLPTSSEPVDFARLGRSFHG